MIFNFNISRRQLWIAVAAATVTGLVGLVIGLTVGLCREKHSSQQNEVPYACSHSVHQFPTTPAGDGLSTTSASRTLSAGVNSAYGTFRFAAVTTDTNICSQIGVNTLARGGSAVDAAIASMFCVGVVNCQSAGIGGGHFATIYDTPRDGRTKEIVTLISRERAPQFAHRDMFVNKSANASSIGGLAIGVPGEVQGHYESWKKFGRLSWSELVEPSVKLCEQGFYVERDLAVAIKTNEEYIRKCHNLAEIFVKQDGSLVQEGDLLVNRKLAATLRTVSASPSSFYNGSLAYDIVEDIKEHGGNVTFSDLKGYRSVWKAPVNVTLANGNYTAFNPPPPASGVVLDFILAILDGFNFSSSDVQTTDQQIEAYHRIIEAFKFAYAKRSFLGDEDFVNVTELVRNLTSTDYAASTRRRIHTSRTHKTEFYGPSFDLDLDHGTAHLNVLAADGSAVAMTSTINLYFGSKVRGSRTGIIFNNEMDDFSTPGTVNFFGVPASPSNCIEPGKMPMSSMSPTLIFGPKENVVFMSGGSGGTKITTGVAFVTVNSLWFGRDLKNATDTPRIHHQLAPNEIHGEPNLDQALLAGLKAKNHTVKIPDFMGRIGSIRNRCSLLPGSRRPLAPVNCIEAVSDGRKGGSPDGY